MEHVKRWFRKWNLDLTKEEVISAINLTKNDPAKYTPSPFDGPYAPEDSTDFNGKTIVNITVSSTLSTLIVPPC